MIFFISGVEMIAGILVGLVICTAHSMKFNRLRQRRAFVAVFSESRMSPARSTNKRQSRIRIQQLVAVDIVAKVEYFRHSVDFVEFEKIDRVA